jgi:polyisoprenoid-binding protein YceI
MKRSLFAILATSLFASAPLFAAEFTVQSGLSSVSFESDATLETIRGTTSIVEGTITTDPATPGTTTAAITVPTSSLRTGVDMRDEHLHSSNWLDAAAHPGITFNVSSVTLADPSATLSHGTTIEATVTGEFSLKGIARTITAPASVSYFAIDNPEIAATYGISSNVLRIETNFDVALADHGVSIPAPMTLKVAPTIGVTVRLTATQN